MKKLFLLPLVLMFIGANAQVKQATDVEDGIFKINIIPLNFSYEMKVGELQTFMLEPGFKFTAYDYDDYNWSFNPYLNLYYRYYYNFEKRNEKGKRTARNSANFVGALANYNFYTNWGDPDLIRGDFPFMAIGPVWGIQRNYKSHFSLGIILGPNISFSPNRVYADAFVKLSLGFHLGGND